MSTSITAPHLSQKVCQELFASVESAYAKLLSEQGYAKNTAKFKLRFLADLNQWLQRQRLQITDIIEPMFEEYLLARHQQFRPRRDDKSILKKLLYVLHTQGFLPKEPPRCPDNPCQRVEQDYDRYLTEERGLSMSTRINYRIFIQKFLSAQFGTKPVRFTDLHAKDVIRFIQNQVSHLSPKRAGLMATALRSFFRYLRYRGDITIDLAACVPAIANWKFSSLPKYLQPHQVQQVLRQCDRRTAKGCRDYAILLILARLGLRACEIVALTLDDLHWQVGEITIRGKGNRPTRLPLPPDVGQAIVAYLKKGRPACSCRHVFIRMRAPLRGFANSEAISTIVARTLKKAGIDSPHTGAHLFRHSLATQMLRQGASLVDIAILLRHRSLNTTTLYAKVDLMALRALAQPWPGGVQ